MKNQLSLIIILAITLVSYTHGMQQSEQKTIAKLMTAASWGHVDTVKKILQDVRTRNINVKEFVNQTDKNGLTALHYAAGCETELFERGSVEIVKLLITAGANPNAQDKNKETPLHKNMYFSEDEKCHWDTHVIIYLLEHGANPLLANNKKVTPLDLFKKIKELKKIKIPDKLLGLVEKCAKTFKN